MHLYHHQNCRQPPSTTTAQSASASQYNLFLHELFLSLGPSQSDSQSEGKQRGSLSRSHPPPLTICTTTVCRKKQKIKRNIMYMLTHTQTQLSVMMLPREGLTFLQWTNQIPGAIVIIVK